MLFLFLFFFISPFLFVLIYLQGHRGLCAFCCLGAKSLREEEEQGLLLEERKLDWGVIQDRHMHLYKGKIVSEWAFQVRVVTGY
jgi:hypothetical protein